MLVTRIAPTPSGYLHEGNAVNFLLTDWLARSQGGRVLLRIDDFDTARARREYLADILDVLRWLGIGIDSGPGTPDDIAAWSMAGRVEQFRAACSGLLATRPEVFVCRCSRTQLSHGCCVAGCRAADLEQVPGSSVVRLSVPPGTTAWVGDQRRAVPAGDHVLWRRDDLPAYQLGSVVADEALGITAVVRGTDLLDSSALQVHLAGLLPAPGFLAADLRHHGLLRAPDGHKLSKSAGAGSAPMPRSQALRGQISDWARELGRPIGITEP